MKGLATFLIGFGVAVALSAGAMFVYDVGEVSITEQADAPGVRLHEDEG